MSGVEGSGDPVLRQVHVWPMELLDEDLQQLDEIADEELVMVNWGELRKLINYNQIISRAFAETSEIFVAACEEIKEEMS